MQVKPILLQTSKQWIKRRRNKTGQDELTVLYEYLDMLTLKVQKLENAQHRDE